MKRNASSFLSAIYDSIGSNNLGKLPYEMPDRNDLEDDIKKIQDELCEMTNQLEDTNAQFALAKQTHNLQIGQVLKLKQQFMQGYNLTSNISNKIKEIKQSYLKCNSFYQKFCKDFESMQKKITEDMKKLKELAEEQAKLEQKNIILKCKIAKYESQKSQLQADFEKCKESKIKLEEENNELEKSCNDLHHEVITKKEQIQDIENKINDIDQKIKTTESVNKNIEEEIKENQIALDNKREESETLSSQSKKLKTELKDLEEEIDKTIKEQAQALESQQNTNQQLNDLQDEMKNLIKILDTEKEKEQKLNEELKDLQETYNNEMHKRDDFKIQIKSITETNILIANENKAIQQEISNKEIKLGELTQELQNIKSLLNEKKMNCKAIEAQIDNETAKQMKQLNEKKDLLKKLKKKKFDLEKQLEDENQDQESKISDIYIDEQNSMLSEQFNDENEVSISEDNQPLSLKLHHFNRLTSTTPAPIPKDVKKNISSRQDSTKKIFNTNKTILIEDLFEDPLSPKVSSSSAKNKFVNHRAALAEKFFNNFISSDKQEDFENYESKYTRTALADALLDENTFKFNS